ncbi:unnamed protein product [Medioppia subpectinata]|uniref:Nudix hydrolase domain-containing protein n=1 Tax=Medioppia subpectinata TaxID=1979941 RepID=A0A7R9KNG4_9ACAR|nr:unnamed protein product [Medioppia subpectinata]CAG2105667.1 unnamed protein product [Medioppia subpectinata]
MRSNAKHLVIILSFICLSPEIECKKLKLLLIVHRHGDRSPCISYPTDPFNNEDQYWPDGYSHLTIKGKQRMYSLGKYLRKRYDHFLGTSPREAWVRSSARERCLESSAMLLAGLYPPTGRWVWNRQLGHIWQPVPIKTVEFEKDGMLNPDSNCPMAARVMALIDRSPAVQQLYRKYKPLMAFIEQKSGMKIGHYWDGRDLFDTLYVQRQNQYSLPDWVNQTVWKCLQQFNVKSFVFDSSNAAIRRLRAGKPNKLFEPIIGQTLHYTVGAIVFDETTGDVLLIQESKTGFRGLWSWPAGKPQPRESLTAAVRRKVCEESGYEIAVTALAVVESLCGQEFRFTFAGRVVGGQLKTWEDCHSMCAQWFTRPELYNYAHNPYRRDRTLKLINTVWHSRRQALKAPPVAIRTHNRMLMRVVFTVSNEKNQYVLVSRRPHPHLPVCALRRKSCPSITLNMFIQRIFVGTDMGHHIPCGVLSVEHNAVSVPTHDGLCLTVLVKCLVPYDKAVPAGDGYVWQAMSLRLARQLKTYFTCKQKIMIEWWAKK